MENKIRIKRKSERERENVETLNGRFPFFMIQKNAEKKRRRKLLQSVWMGRNQKAQQKKPNHKMIAKQETNKKISDSRM